MRRLYFDNSATSFPKPPEVLAAITRYANDLGASAGRGAYREAVETGRVLSDCRKALCRLLGGEKPEHFIFTLNCSDALNMAIKGMVLPGGNNHFVCTHICHNSILRPLAALEEQGIAEVTRVPVSETGLVNPDDVRKAIRPDTRLVCITHASNVTGTLQPLAPLVRATHDAGSRILVDAAQSAGHVPIDLKAEEIDFLAAPGHKALLGPLGTGFLYIRPGLERVLRVTREGGTGSVSETDRQPDFMPDRFESGSHNALGLAGLLAGVEWILAKGVPALWEHDRDLCRPFIDALGRIGGVRYFGPQGVRDRVGVFSVRVEGLSPLELAAILESQFGILTRPGLHCAPLIHKAIGTLDSGGTTRFSFGPFLSVRDVAYCGDALCQIASNVGR